MTMDIHELIQQAFLAREYSYSPYSHFMVGAALYCRSGKIYQGCNIENAAYSPGNCAERTAIFKAVSHGDRDFDCIVIVGGLKGTEIKTEDGGIIMQDYCPPCGMCRQVMMEFCDPEKFKIILAKSVDDYREYTLEELLPLGFGASQIQ